MGKGRLVNRAKANRVGMRETLYPTLWAQAPARPMRPGAASSYLELRPVHGHARPVVGSEPPQVLHSIGSFDVLLQVAIDVFVAKSERGTGLFQEAGMATVHLSWPSAWPQQAPRSAADFMAQIRTPTLVQLGDHLASTCTDGNK